MYRKSINFLFWGLCLLLGITACNSPLKVAKKSYNRAEYQKAIGQLKELLNTGEDKAEINGLIAESYRRSNRMKEAEAYYKAALDANSNNDTVRFYYAYALKNLGKYQEAQQRFETYAKSGKNSEFIRRARAEAQNIKQIEEITKRKTYYEVKNCSGINTEAAEFAPTVFEDKILYGATRKEAVYEGNGMPFAGIYAHKIKDWENCEGFSTVWDEKIFLQGVNESSPTFSPDGSMVIFARGGSGKKGESNEVDLYSSTRNSDGTWSDPEILPYPININRSILDAGNENLKGSKENAWTACPFIRPDGKRLYFASNRKGGYGGVDIWQADINGSRITNVRNLGKEVNTPGNEFFPFVSDAGILYFSSDGHPGLGGLDVFEAVRSQGETKIKNLGLPINSPADDFGLMFQTDSTGYFSSNREGGKGDDDIYSFKDITPDKTIVHYYLVINVVGVDPRDKDKKEIPLPNAKIAFSNGTKVSKGQKITDLQANNEGKTSKIKINAPSNYVISADAGDEYFRDDFDYTTYGRVLNPEVLENDHRREIDTTYEAKVVLEKIIVQGDGEKETEEITYELEINFGFNEFNIRPDAAKILDKFIEFLQRNPQISFELGSHTDAVGTDERNRILSQNRAESTRDYLVEKGIDPDRITAVIGYGESKLKVNTPEANEINRRTEFKVTKITRPRR
jgi:outer membrane protein OmpA-like peptidoglycan-associated protein